MAEATSHEKITVCNPATGKKIAELNVSTADEVRMAAARARIAQKVWEGFDFQTRARVLYRFRDLLIDHKEEIADTLTAESGKPRGEAYGNELFYVCDALGFWAKFAARYLKPQRIRPHLLKSKKIFSIHSPLGLVGAS